MSKVKVRVMSGQRVKVRDCADCGVECFASALDRKGRCAANSSDPMFVRQRKAESKAAWLERAAEEWEEMEAQRNADCQRRSAEQAGELVVAD